MSQVPLKSMHLLRRIRRPVDLGRPHRCHRDDLGEGPPRFRVCGGISTFITILNARFLPMFRSCLCPAYKRPQVRLSLMSFGNSR